MKHKAFVDTNVLIYLYSEDEIKRKIAQNVIKTFYVIINTQVIGEFVTVLTKKLGYNKEIAITEAKRIVKVFEILPIDFDTVKLTFCVFKDYMFSYFDAQIVASALLSESDILFSEDMQDGLQVYSKLIIKNPFK